MWESIWNSSNIYYAMGIVAAGGIASKMVVDTTLKRLVKAASNMAKSTHKFMKLVRAKFEHACMISDQVENVDVFVDKFIYEYEVCGIRLHSWKKFAMNMIWTVLFLTLLAGGTTYYYQGTQEMLLQRTGVGIALMVLMFSLYQVGDEKYQLQVIKLYMVDYLENVCARRYSRNRKEGQAIQGKQVAAENNVVAGKQVLAAGNRAMSGKQVLVAGNRAMPGNQSVLENQEAEGKQIVVENQVAKLNQTKKRKGFKKIGIGKPVVVEVPMETAVPAEMQTERASIGRLEKLLIEEAERREGMKKQKQEEAMPNEAAIREILQEYMV